MADPLSQAVEELAPARASTNFFGNANPAFRAAAAGRQLEDQEMLSRAIGGLADSRLQRRLRRREEMLFDREEQEVAAKERWMIQRGQFLSDLGAIGPANEDYFQTRNELIATMPPEALQDDAVRAILRSKDDQYKNWQTQQEAAAYEERYMQRGRQDMIDRARATYLRLGGDPDQLDAMEGGDEFENIMIATGRLERQVAEEKLRAEMQAEANEPISPSEARTRIAAAIEDDQAFPSYVKDLHEEFKAASKADAGVVDRSLENLETQWPDRFARAKEADDRKAADYIAAATRTSKEQFVNYRKGLSEQAKERRAKVWEWAQLAMGEEPASMEVGPASPAQAPVPQEAAPEAAPVDAEVEGAAPPPEGELPFREEQDPARRKSRGISVPTDFVFPQ